MKAHPFTLETLANHPFILEKDVTSSYHDRYNAPCHCRECALFRKSFSAHYPTVVTFLESLGVVIDYPIEIMDLFFHPRSLKRHYMAYYSVKGRLPFSRMTTTLDGATLILRNHEVASEAYANTGMQPPFFIVEVDPIYLPDTEGLLIESLQTGREIEFSYGDFHYFISRNSKEDWYIYCEETHSSQHFPSYESLLTLGTLQNILLSQLWEHIQIDCIL